MHRGRRDWVLAACFLLLHSFLPAYLSDDTCNLCCGFQRCGGNLHKSITIENYKKTLLILETSKIVLEFCCPAHCPEPFVVLLNLWQQRRTGTTRGRCEDMWQRLHARLAGTQHASESSEAQKHHRMPQFKAWDAATAKSLGQKGFAFQLYERSFYNTRPWCC